MDMQGTALIRNASMDDVETLAALEEASFSGDRVSRRSFRYLLSRGKSLTLLDALAGNTRGYLTLLFRAKRARVYTIATAAAWRGHGVAAQLVRAAEQAALARGCTALYLEVRKDNVASIALFAGNGYRVFGEYEAYYDDGMDAWRMEKTLPE
ncbi:GNAT family N-acetyltransferase [Massilia violaceinigra]|uniref:GNAT family N-acetyltransferase n=1 Tax=Massilia violaceinigra TaxID=2045208 RepID=A0ABY4AGC7_9BURK|nr:N-acetyltransferase [Massilia violaceinigra]UOD31643.1 GNAT family N-acetyltransferase [Massilia violaceinigra]